MKQKTIISLMVVLSLTLLMGGVGQAFVMNGNVLTVGIDNSGGLVDLAAPPTVASNAGQGITYNPGPLPNDFTAPDRPWEFYALGVGGNLPANILVGGVAPTAYPYTASNPMGLNTYNNSGGTQFKADSNGPSFALGGALLSYDQSVSFDTNSNTIKFKADIFNVGTTTATNVVYARGFDPDPDENLFTTNSTTNTFPGPGSVQAVGPQTGLFARIDDVQGGGVASISGFASGLWELNPYVLIGGGLVNGAIASNPLDYSINMAWAVGDILPGHSVEIDWTYTFGQVPLPPSVYLLGSGLLGLVGFRFRRKSS